MSITVTNCRQINGDPCNSSSAKQLFSFKNERRFRTPAAYNKRLCYDTGGHMGIPRHKHVQTSFGIARPELFSQKENFFRPSPDSYLIKSKF